MEWFDAEKNAFVKPTKDELIVLLVACSCGSTDWKHERSDIHGVGYRCSKCNKFDGWSGKRKDKAKNPKFAKKQKRSAPNGVRTCDLCGISEAEAKKFGWHFTTDHRLAEEFGGEDTLENSRPLCSPCHYLKTALEHKTRGIKKFLDPEDAA